MRTAAVIERILNELKTGQADAVKGLMVSAAGIVERKGLRIEIGERREPASEHRSNGFVALHIDTTNSAGTVVQVEVGGELLVVMLADEFSARRRVRRRLRGRTFLV